MRRTIVTVVVAAAALALPSPASRGAVPVLVIEGRGFGHGVGMAQDGALSMGQAGSTVYQILGQFYPGTSIGRKAGFVRVPVLVAPSREAVVSFPNGGQLRDTLGDDQSPGFPIEVSPGARARIRFDGRYTVTVEGAVVRSAAQIGEPPPTAPPVEPTTTTTSGGTTTTTGEGAGEAPTTTTAAARPSSVVEATSPRPILAVPATGGTISVDSRARRYRGFVEANAAQGPLRLVNQVDVEQYLRGMGEVRNPRWPLDSLKAQSIAARTYALRTMAAVGEVCETQRCQVYLGQQAEYPQMDRAVRETQGQVIVYRGALASAVYSANGGGFAASPEEGFGPGAGGHPYLRAAPYLSKDPHPWTVRVGFGDLAARFGYRGQVSAVRISRTGPSGRALKVALEGTAGVREVDGVRFDAALGLKSTLFSLRVEQAEAAPPPPAAEAVMQALPEQQAAAGPPPSVAPDTPLEDLGIALRPRPLVTSTTRRGGTEAASARTSSAAGNPWTGLAVFLLVTTCAGGAVALGAKKGAPPWERPLRKNRDSD